MNSKLTKPHIRILCTARFCLKKDLLPALKLLEKWGFNVSLGETIGKIHHQFGGTIEERARDFQTALEDENIDYIWIARGGYGTVQIIEKLHLDRITLSRKLNKKTIIGYSDLTYLHAVWNKLGLQSMHSFMPMELNKKPVECINHLKNTLLGNSLRIVISNQFDIQSAIIKGEIVGGNLSILYGLLGSSDFPDTTQKILFIEDTDEYLYHIERMMYSLKRSGSLNYLKALIVGGMTEIKDHEIPFGKDAIQIIKDITFEYDYPIISNFPAGHLDDHKTIIFNQPTTINITEKEISIIQDNGIS